MTETTQETILVGMDAHSEKIALCVTRWQHGSDPTVLKQITTTLDSLETTYRRQVPAGALTVLEVGVPWADLVEGCARITDFHVGRG